MLRLLRLLVEYIFSTMQSRRPIPLSKQAFYSIYLQIEELLYVTCCAIILVIVVDILRFQPTEKSSIVIEDSDHILGLDIIDKLNELGVSVMDSLPQDTHPALLLCVEHLVDRVNRSLFQKLRERCIRTAGNCVLVVVHGNKTSQSVLDSIRDEYNSVSGLTRSVDKKLKWTNNHDDAAVEYSQVIFLPSVVDDSGPYSVLRLHDSDQFVRQVRHLTV